MSQFKAILFDSGRVLNRPKTGYWFIPPNFFSIIDREQFTAIPRDRVEAAQRKSQICLNNTPSVLTEDEEYHLFLDYFQIFSDELHTLKLSIEQIEKLAYDTVYNDDKFVFYDDVFSIVPELYERYKLGVVSDTWPSLERVFRNAGLREYFSTFVMSSILGVLKPHERMFLTALMELEVNPEEALFIDDNVMNLDGAKKLGLHTCLMLRHGKLREETQQHYVVSNLQELKNMLIWRGQK